MVWDRDRMEAKLPFGEKEMKTASKLKASCKRQDLESIKSEELAKA